MDVLTITSQKIAIVLKKSSRSIRRMAEKEKWSYRIDKNGTKLFILSLLPDYLKIAIAIDNQKKLSIVSSLKVTSPMIQEKNGTLVPSGKHLDKGMAKADLLNLYTKTINSAAHGRKAHVRTEFMRAYNSGIAYPKIFKMVGTVSWKTVEVWKRTIKTHRETFSLCDQRGMCRKGKSVLTDQQKDILLQCALHPNKPLIAESIRMAWSIMSTKGIPNGHSSSTYRRWLQDWASINNHIWTFSRKGAKAWNDECAMYIERDYKLINVGDIIVADGHTLNFEILNPWTGKPKRMTLIVWLDMKSSYPLGWEIMPTENTQAISAALRRAIIALGKYPQVAYLDNGRAFKSRFFTNTEFDESGFEGLYRRLGIKTIFAWPYHGQSKTIERFFGTFSELERWAPTYSGTSIEKKPPRMMRGEVLHRRLYNKVQNNCLTMEQAHRSIAAWFETYVNRPQRGHLEGLAPADLFLDGKGQGIDKTELTYLMMTRQTRAIRQNGINLQGTNYYHPFLYGRKHMATIKYDMQDMSAIYVYDQHGKYICEAKPVEKAHPAAYILGTSEDQKKLKKLIEVKKHQEKSAGSLVREILELEVLPAHKKQMEEIAGQEAVDQNAPKELGNVRKLPRLSDSAGKLEKEMAVIQLKQAAEKAAKKEENKKRIDEGMQQYNESLGKTISRNDINPDVEIERESILDDSPDIWKLLPEMEESQRYEKLTEYEVRGWMIPKQWQAFMSYFEQTPGYLDRVDYYDDHRGRVAEMFDDNLTQKNMEV